jgi:hypothetical protein
VLRSVFSTPNLDSESIYNYNLFRVASEYKAQAIIVNKTAIAIPTHISSTVPNHVSYYRCVDKFYFTFVTINHRSAFFFVILAKHKVMLF